MVGYSESLERFNAAIKRCDLEAAKKAARELAARGPFTVHNGLELLVLMARAGDAGFEATARRWLELLARERCDRERVRTLTEMQIASTAVAGLGDIRIARRCEGVLRELIRWIDEGA